MNVGKLQPTIVNTCVALSKRLPFLTAQAIPSGIVIASVKIVAKIFRIIVFSIGAPIISITSF